MKHHTKDKCDVKFSNLCLLFTLTATLSCCIWSYLGIASDNTGYWLFVYTDMTSSLTKCWCKKIKKKQSQRYNIEEKNNVCTVWTKPKKTKKNLEPLFLQFCLASLVVHKWHVSPIVSVIAWDDMVTETFCYLEFCHFVCHTHIFPHFLMAGVLL